MVLSRNCICNSWTFLSKKKITSCIQYYFRFLLLKKRTGCQQSEKDVQAWTQTRVFGYSTGVLPTEPLWLISCQVLVTIIYKQDRVTFQVLQLVERHYIVPMTRVRVPVWTLFYSLGCASFKQHNFEILKVISYLFYQISLLKIQFKLSEKLNVCKIV